MKRFFSRPSVRFLLLLALVLAVIYLGATLLHIKERLTVVGLFSAITLLCFVVYSLRTFFRERRLPWGLLSQAKKQSELAGPEAQAAFKDLEGAFERAFDELARQKPGTHVFRRDGAESLPWIILMGPSGAGKTTALDQSGLHFSPLGRRVKGIGGTRNCVWWLAEEAVLLDTAGSYTNPEQGHSEWLGFLSLLKRFRGEQPIDGVILQVGLDELEKKTPREREQLALELRGRLDELIQQLGVCFPVHLVFSKCDRLEGFTPFFERQPVADREQPWGFSLDVRSLERGSLAPLFSERYGELGRALLHRLPNGEPVLDASHNELRASPDQLAALAFPQELARRREMLLDFTELLFEPSRHRERPQLSGVYFISSEQKERAFPGTRHALARETGIVASAPHQPFPATNPYFLQGFFKQVIKEAQSAARPSEKAQRAQRTWRLVASAALSILCLLASWWLMLSYLDDAHWLRRLEVLGKQVTTAPVLDALRAERKLVAGELDRQEQLRLLLEERDASGVLETAHLAGQTLLRERVDRSWILPLADALNQDLEKVATWRKGDSGEDYAFGYLALKADFVLQRKQCPAADPEDTQRWAGAYFTDLWRRQWGDQEASMLKDGTRTSACQQSARTSGEQGASMLTDGIGRALPRQVEYFVSGTQRSHLHLDEEFLDKARKALKIEVPSDEVLFHLIVSNAGLTPVEPLLEGKVLCDEGLKLAFTPEGCSEFRRSIEKDREGWGCVLGIENPQLKGREDTYTAKYVKAREAWLEGLKLAPAIRSIADTQQALGRLVDPQKSELDQVFHVMASEPLMGGRLHGSNSGRVKRQSLWQRFRLWMSGTATETRAHLGIRDVCAEIKDPFSSFALAFQKDGNPMARALERYKASVVGEKENGGLRKRLREIDLSSNREPEALALVRETMGGKGPLSELIQARIDLMDTLRNASPPANPSGLESSLASLESAVGSELMSAATRGLQEEWSHEVYDGWTRVISGGQLEQSEMCTRRQEYLKANLVPFVNNKLGVFFLGGSFRKCKLKPVLGRTMNITACGQLNEVLRLLEVMKCPEPSAPGGGGGGGGQAEESAEPRFTPPLLAESNQPGCRNDIEWVQLDTGSDVYEYNVSLGRCMNCTSPRKSQLARAQIQVKRRLERHPTLVEAAPDLETLLKLGRRDPNDRGRIEFELKGASDCPKIAVAFVMPPEPPRKSSGGAPPPPPPDNSWRRLRELMPSVIVK